MSAIAGRSLAQIAAELESGIYSSVELTERCLSEIERDELGIFITVTPEQALFSARQSDRRRAAGERLSVLDGIPMAVKDNLCTKNIRTSCASRMLESFVPDYDATAVSRLLCCGAVMLGKLNMDEFGMGGSGDSSFFGAARNPRNPEHTAGGSSGGAAAAVAAGLAAYALGSDTGGSVRQPAALCGVTGLRPSYGRVSRSGLAGLAGSLDQVGVIAGNVRDCALVLGAISGEDAADSTTLPGTAPDFTGLLDGGISGMKIALLEEQCSGMAQEVKAALLETVKVCEGLGAKVERVSVPLLDTALPVYEIISAAESSVNLARYDGIRYGYRAAEYGSLDELYTKSRTEGFGREVRRRLMLGTLLLMPELRDTYYNRATRVRTLIKSELDRLLESFDLLLSPTVPTLPWRLGESRSIGERRDCDSCGVAAALAGLPAISIPVAGAGMQLTAGRFAEAELLAAANAITEADR